MRRRVIVLALAACIPSAGCTKTEEVIVETAADAQMSATDIDADPWALLPSGAVSWLSLDARALFGSQFGAQVIGLMQRRLPIVAAAEFEPTRDIDQLALGVYSLSGVDLAGIARGRFQAERFADAVARQAVTVQGRPMTVATYAGRQLYLADGVGMTFLTPTTMAFGNEIGMRRILDRIEEGRAIRTLPAWFESMLATQNAPFAWGADLASHPLPDAARRQATFLKGLRAARLLGNFEPPGLNLAGTLTYDDEDAARRGAVELEENASALRTYGYLMTMLGVQQPLRRLDSEIHGRDLQVVAEVDGAAMGGLIANMDRIAQMLGQ